MPRYLDIQELQKRIAEGDFTALNELYRRYYRKLKLYGIQFSPKLSSLSIDDTIQELFLWLSKNHKNLHNIESLDVYLFSALKRNIYQDIHKNQSRKNLMVLYTKNSTRPEHEHSAETNLIRSESLQYNKDLVQNLLETLPSKQKEVLYLRNYINMSYKEIAEVMDLSEQIVRNYSYKAMKKLKNQSALNSKIKEG